MNRISEKFKELRAAKKKALIAYITAGYPDLKATEALVLALERAGADIIELGVPFSDPLADGPTIQKASYEALQGGVTLKKILATVTAIRRVSQVPVALMTYYNPVFHWGEASFMKAAHAAWAGKHWLVLVVGAEAGHALSLFTALSETARRFLGLTPVFLGCIANEPPGEQPGPLEAVLVDLLSDAGGRQVEVDRINFEQYWQRMWLYSRLAAEAAGKR